MNDITTCFGGLQLKNPIIVASSNKTNNAENNQGFERDGAAAVVLKSLFEENIVRQTDSMLSGDTYIEGEDYLQLYLRNSALNEYLKLISDSKRLCTIPIIASINCCTMGEWVEFAKLIEQSGADALELNIMGLQSETDYQDGAYEQLHVDIVSQVRKHFSLPLIVKLGSNLTNPIALIHRLKAAGANGIVLFNRMYQTDIDIESLTYTHGNVLSSEQDLALPLRCVGIASEKVPNMDYALSGGVHNPDDVVKAILAGASAVEVCSVLYHQGGDWMKTATERLQQWQEKHAYRAIEEYKGKMNAKHQEGEDRFNRTQFLKYFESFKK